MATPKTDWRETVMANIHARSVEVQRNARGDWVPMSLRLHPDIRNAIKQISERRNVSMATYLRRLLVMAVTKELDEPLADWVPKNPAPMLPNNGHLPGMNRHKVPKTADTGDGMEGMCTHPGCNLIHW